jgi:endonuclease/exonuclease/phosphatase family metal-dependent hydrolase
VKRLAALALAGCAGLDMTADQPWIAIDSIAAPLVPDGAPPPTSKPAPAGPLRVVSYNLQFGPDIPGAAAALAGDPALAAAHVILIQEIEAYPEEGATRAARFATALGMGFVYVPARVRDTGTHGLAIVSAYPITNVEKMVLPESESHAIHRRIAIAADIDVSGRTLHVIDVHLDTKLNARERIAQLHPAVIDAPDATLVGGDFNTSWVAWADGVPILETTGASDQGPIMDSYMAGLAFDTPTADCGPTEHMFGIEQRLDAIYTRGLGATFGGVVRAGPSDHWPLWIDVALP